MSRAYDETCLIYLINMKGNLIAKIWRRILLNISLCVNTLLVAGPIIIILKKSKYQSIFKNSLCGRFQHLNKEEQLEQNTQLMCFSVLILYLKIRVMEHNYLWKKVASIVDIHSPSLRG